MIYLSHTNMNIKLLIASLTICMVVKAQTNVSGGIFSNTIWTKANSPYIVTDNLVVFPNVTLTIQAGVTVKLDSNVILEIRQAKLNAVGTPTDSITFTSNSVSPTPGIYVGIYLNGGALNSQFNYCNFKYAIRGIKCNNINYVLCIKNSNFIFNNYGLYTYGSPGTSTIIDTCNFSNNIRGMYGSAINNFNSCNISNNVNGIEIGTGTLIIKNSIINFNSWTGIRDSPLVGSVGTIFNCTIKHNQIGIKMANSIAVDSCNISSNEIGLFGVSSSTIKNCIIDSNSTSGIEIGTSNSIVNNQIRYNGIGINETQGGNRNIITGNIIEYDSIGLSVGIPTDIINCNKICNNTSFGLRFTGSSNTYADSYAHNYWCTSDSASIAAMVFDGYDAVSLGLVTFIAIDTIQCYLTTSIKEDQLIKISFIFPNPSSGKFTIKADGREINKVEITNILGEEIYKSSDIVYLSQINIDLSAKPKGIYFVKITMEHGAQAVNKIVVQ